MNLRDSRRQTAPGEPGLPQLNLDNGVIFLYRCVYRRLCQSYGFTGGCSGWPLCNGEWFPELTGGVGIVFMHRVAAALLFLLTAILGHLAFWRYKKLPELRMLGVAAVTLCLLQVFSGAAVVHTLYNDKLYIFAALSHIVLIAGLFGVLSYMSVRVWQQSGK